MFELKTWIEIPIKIRVSHYRPADPGFLSGPPENCWPPEGPELDMTVVTKSGSFLSEHDIPQDVWDELTQKAIEALEDAAAEARIDRWEDAQW